MFAIFVLIVLVGFGFVICRTYYRRWRNDRGLVDPQAGERARVARASGMGKAYQGHQQNTDVGGFGGSGNVGGGGF